MPLLVAGLLLVRFGVHRADVWLTGDPARLPPVLQIRRQAQQLAQQIAPGRVPDPEVGALYAPNLARAIETDDFVFTFVTDRRGFPNASSLDRADIVFLGDSLLVGYGVGIDRGFVQLVDDGLPDRTLINLSNGGAGPERQARIYRRHGASAGADLVVSCIYLASDFENDWHFREWLADPMGENYDEFRGSYQWRQDLRSWSLTKLLERRHPTYEWLRSVVEPRLWGGQRLAHAVDLADGRLLLDRRNVMFAKAELSDNAPEIGRLTAAIDNLRSLARADGATFAVVLVPSKEEVYGVTAEATAKGPAAVVARRLRAMNVPVLDLIPALRTRGRERMTYYPRDIHLNEFGSMVVADEIVDWIRDLPRPAIARAGG